MSDSHASNVQPIIHLHEFLHLTLHCIAGPLLKSIFDSMLKKRREPSARLFKVYSGHDDTLVVLLNTLRIWDDVPPPYSAAVFIELRFKDGLYYVTVSFPRGSVDRPIPLPAGFTPSECSHPVGHRAFSGAIQDFGHGTASSAGASKLQKPVRLGSIYHVHVPLDDVHVGTGL